MKGPLDCWYENAPAQPACGVQIPARSAKKCMQGVKNLDYKQRGVMDEKLSRRFLTNPCGDMKHFERLTRSKSIDLRANHIIEDLGNGYSRILPIDEEKKFG